MDALLELIAAGPVFDWLGELLQSEVAKMTLAFMVAARLHRAWVKKDMTEQFARITSSIDNLADRLTMDLTQHSRRIDDLSSRVTRLEGDD